MQSYIAVSRKWSDDDVIELVVEISDGASKFVNTAYVHPEWPTQVANALKAFSGQVYGGNYDLKAGAFGPEFANGCVEARFHYYKPNQLMISTIQESGYGEFKGGEVASRARMYLRTEAALIDRFVQDLPTLKQGDNERVVLECIGK